MNVTIYDKTCHIDCCISYGVHFFKYIFVEVASWLGNFTILNNNNNYDIYSHSIEYYLYYIYI